MSARLVMCIDGQVRRISDCWDPEDRDLSAVSKPAPAPTDSTTKRYSSIEATAFLPGHTFAMCFPVPDLGDAAIRHFSPSTHIAQPSMFCAKLAW